MAVKFGLDDVNGQCIGGMCIRGQLHKYSDGSPQGPMFTGDTDAEVREQAVEWFNTHGGKSVYPDGLELRLRG